jgi:hypothetical protein
MNQIKIEIFKKSYMLIKVVILEFTLTHVLFLNPLKSTYQLNITEHV